MDRVPEWIEERWNIPAFESDIVQSDNATYYQTVLAQTNDLTLEYAEKEWMEKHFGDGRAVEDLYTQEELARYRELLEARQFCREKLRKLEV